MMSHTSSNLHYSIHGKFHDMGVSLFQIRQDPRVLPSEARTIWRESACKVGVRHDGSGVKDVLGLVYGDNSTTMTMTGTTHF